MERGIYFDAWFPGQHNYHPSLPQRRLRMIEHLEEYRGTLLVWSALGGGNLSLPFLEDEAFGEVPPRYRVYGFLNDREFVAECDRRGVKVFAVVFEHAWEYPAEVSELEDELLALNEMRGAGKRVWLGIREFWQDRYPNLWKTRNHYFREPLLNAWGEPVDDILEECAQRDIHGEPCHADWVECPDRDHWNYMMDRNNPVWREYLKAVVRLQVDAGVHGILFDEAEVPITSPRHGTCFCRTCMRGFREYLSNLPEDERPSMVEASDLSTFHYGRWLLARGYDFKSRRETTPLFAEYQQFQRQNIAHYFAELADYAREHARAVGRNVLISGNFYDLADYCYALEPHVDVIVTEMRKTTYRQPEWYRYAAGFAAGKSLVVVENPYGGVVPELVARLKKGQAYDRFRMSLYEAAALGVNMSVPYGAWMGSEIQDAYYPPHEVAVEVQSFLADHDSLFGTGSSSEVAVVFSVATSFRLMWNRTLVDDLPPEESGRNGAFWRVCQVLSASTQPYDVVFFPDGEIRKDSLVMDDLSRYSTIVLPDCQFVTEAQHRLLRDFLESGRRIVVVGSFGSNLTDRDRREITAHPGSKSVAAVNSLSLGDIPDGPQLVPTWRTSIDMAVALQSTAAGVALHFIRYDYDEHLDAVPVLEELGFALRLPFAVRTTQAFDPTGDLEVSVDGVTEGRQNLRLHRVSLYGIVMLMD